MDMTKIENLDHLKSTHKSQSVRKYFVRLKNDLIRDRYLYLLLLPVLVWYVVFKYKPMWGLQIAFQDFSPYKGIAGSSWVGLEHFQKFLGSTYFFRTLKNTLIINLYGIVFGFPAPIILSLMLNEVKNKSYKKTIQTITYLPHFISIVVVAGMVTNFLSPNTGLVNMIIEHLGGEKIYFLTKKEYFRTIFISMNIWKETGFGAVVYIAALSGIDLQLYEAAIIDGANKWKQLIHITLPGIMPTIVTMLILKIGNLLTVGYEAIILLYQPSTYETADVISTYVYRSGIAEGRYDMATAVGLFNAVIALVLVYAANTVSKKYLESGLW